MTATPFAHIPGVSYPSDKSPSPSESDTAVLPAPTQLVRVTAPGIDICAKLTPEQVGRLVAFTLELVSPQP